MTEQRAGSLRDRVSIMRVGADAVGTRGQRVATFSEYEKRWARFQYLSGTELERARKVYAETTASCVIRKPTNHTITTKDRIQFKSTTYGIGSATPSGEDHNDLVLLLAEVQ